MTFKDGGAFDFHQKFLEIKERLQQVVAVAQESGQMTGDGSESGPGRGGGALSGINMANVHLEQLPAYEEATQGSRPSNLMDAPILMSSSGSPPPANGATVDSRSGVGSGAQEQSAVAGPQVTAPTPMDAPPGYEEVQRASVATELERSIRGINSL